MSERIVCLIVLAAVFCLAFGVAGCAGAPVIPVEPEPGEVPEEQPEAEPTEAQPAEEQPAQEQPALDETEGEKIARVELEAAIAGAKELAGQKKFDEALAALGAVISKYEGSPLQTLGEARELEKEIKTTQQEEARRLFLEAAKASYDETIKKCDEKIQGNEYVEALKVLEGYPAEYAETEFKAKVEKKNKEVRALYARWKEYKEMLKAAETEYKVIEPQARELAKQDKHQEALDLLGGYPAEYADTEWATKVAEVAAEIGEAKAKYEELERLKAQARGAFDEKLVQSRALVKDKKFKEALALFEDFPAEYEQFGYREKLAQKREEVQKEWDAYKEEMFQEAAREKYEEIVADVDGLAAEKEFDRALAQLDSYPVEYDRTEWPEQIAAKKAEVEAAWTAYKERQAFLKEATGEADRIIGEAQESAGANEFDKALEVLGGYPPKYKDTDSQARVTAEIEQIRGQQEEYQKQQTKTAIIVAVVIVVLLVIVIAISARKKGKGPKVPAIAARPEPVPEVPEEPQEVEAEEVTPEEEKPEAGEPGSEEPQGSAPPGE